MLIHPHVLRLLEVGDRANAVQNELSRLQGRRTVRHADGGQSALPPAAAFVRSSTGLAEPLLEKSEEKIDEFRAAYRQWRTGCSPGATSSQEQKLRLASQQRSPAGRVPRAVAAARAVAAVLLVV